MSLIELIVAIVIVGFVVWIVTLIDQIPPKFKMVIQGLAVLFLVLWVLDRLGYTHTGVRLR